MVEEISRQANVQAIVWLLFGALNQFYLENQEQKSQLNYLKVLSFVRKEALVMYGPTKWNKGELCC